MEDCFLFSQHTHGLHGDVLLVMAIKLSNSLLVYIDQNDIIVHYNAYPNLGVYRATFPNLKGPSAPPKIAKNPLLCIDT